MSKPDSYCWGLKLRFLRRQTPNIWEAAHLDPPGSGRASGRKTLRVFAQTPNTLSGFVLSVDHAVPLSLTLSH
jgi:hypothetical protein